MVSIVAQHENYAKWAQGLLDWLQDGPDSDGFSNALLLAMVVEFIQAVRISVHGSSGHLKNGASTAVRA